MNLWQADQIATETQVVLAGETLPALFWNAVNERGAQVWLRQKELVDLHAKSFRVIGIERMFRVDICRDAAFLLRFRDDMQCERRFP